MGHLKEEFRFGMLMWDRGHQISLSKTMGTGNNENKSNSWAQVTSLVFFTELGNQQDNVVTMAPRPRVLRPALHKWGLVRVSTHWDQTGRLWWWWGGGGVLWGILGSYRRKLELAGRKGRMSARNKKVLSPSRKVPGALGERACALAAPTNGDHPVLHTLKQPSLSLLFQDK